LPVRENRPLLILTRRGSLAFRHLNDLLVPLGQRHSGVAMYRDHDVTGSLDDLMIVVVERVGKEHRVNEEASLGQAPILRSVGPQPLPIRGERIPSLLSLRRVGNFPVRWIDDRLVDAWPIGV
jgi:hypothetical protein